MYTITLSIDGKDYKGEGDTPAEALASLEKPDKLMLKGTLTMTNGEESKFLILNPAQIKRLFYFSPSIRAVRAKQIFALMK